MRCVAAQTDVPAAGRDEEAGAAGRTGIYARAGGSVVLLGAIDTAIAFEREDHVEGRAAASALVGHRDDKAGIVGGRDSPLVSVLGGDRSAKFQEGATRGVADAQRSAGSVVAVVGLRLGRDETGAGGPGAGRAPGAAGDGEGALVELKRDVVVARVAAIERRCGRGERIGPHEVHRRVVVDDALRDARHGPRRVVEAVIGVHPADHLEDIVRRRDVDEGPGVEGADEVELAVSGHAERLGRGRRDQGAEDVIGGLEAVDGEVPGEIGAAGPRVDDHREAPLACAEPVGRDQHGECDLIAADGRVVPAIPTAIEVAPAGRSCRLVPEKEAVEPEPRLALCAHNRDRFTALETAHNRLSANLEAFVRGEPDRLLEGNALGLCGEPSEQRLLEPHPKVESAVARLEVVAEGIARQSVGDGATVEQSGRIGRRQLGQASLASNNGAGTAQQPAHASGPLRKLDA